MSLAPGDKNHINCIVFLIIMGLCLNIFCVGQAARGSARNISQQKGSAAQKVWEPLLYRIAPYSFLETNNSHSPRKHFRLMLLLSEYQRLCEQTEQTDSIGFH